MHDNIILFISMTYENTGVVMELEDCSSHLLHQISMTSDPQEAFQEADYAILLGAMPRKEGMLRKDLLRLNAGIFKVQGEAINQVAKKSVKVLVVGNPANTNAMICSQFAPTIPSYQFTALTKLDENRAVSLLAQHFQVQSHRLRNVCIWGNHSNTQFPDIAYAEIEKNEIWVPIPPLPDTFTDSFISKVSLRGAAILAARKFSSAMSAAKAIGDHLRDWHHGLPTERFTSMGVVSNGEYGVPKGLVFSFPVTITKKGEWQIVPNLPISPFTQSKLDITIQELEEERKEALLHVNP
ncbi:hypothetical protein HMI56_000674 [Coelomomyces lativittatus]|nr:hypothetical protein HMI56_000674 [Coelomomyces lativittatus]